MIKKVNMINAFDLKEAIELQYDYNFDWKYISEIALALGFSSWVEGAHLLYFGPDYEPTDNLETCIIFYLRDILPNDEYIWINFDD